MHETVKRRGGHKWVQGVKGGEWEGGQAKGASSCLASAGASCLLQAMGKGYNIYISEIMAKQERLGGGVGGGVFHTNSEGLTKEIMPHFGLPGNIQSDHGPAFVSEIPHKVSKFSGIKWRVHTTWRPQAYGKVKRMNHTLKKI